MDEPTSTAKTTNYGEIKGRTIIALCQSIAGPEFQTLLPYMTSQNLPTLLSRMLPGNLIADFINSDAMLRGSGKFMTSWDEQDLDTLIEILRLGFTAGVYHERVSNRSRANNRNSPKARKILQNVRGKLS